MAAPTPADFKTRFPEWAAIDDSRIQFFIDDAVLEVGAGPWGTLYEKGVLLLAAHFLTLDQIAQGNKTPPGSLDGNVTSRSVGDVSVSFGLSSTESGNTSEEYLKKTTYGVQFLRLQKRAGHGAIVVT